MIKTGLYRIEQLSSLQNTRGFFGGTRRISITLYDKAAGIRDGEKWAERILSLFSDERGAYKRTYRRRFDDFDTLAIRHIADAFDAGRALVVHDAGVSDARTACDFFHAVSARFHNMTYYASDCEPIVSVLQLGNIKVTMNQKGRILEIVLPPFVFNTIKPENFRRYPINYLFFQIARNIWAPRVLAAQRMGKIQPSSLSLFCADAIGLAKRDRRFRLLDHDLLAGAPFPVPVDVVRVMNVLNSSYFSDQDLARTVGRIFDSLGEDGLLVVGSNEEAGSQVRGAIYRKVNGGFAELARSGAAHDAHRAIVGYSPSAAA
jgi:hypothetical protein